MSCPWGDAPVVGIDDFCEAIEPCGWVLQPMGTLSALAFLPVALLIARWAKRHRMPALHLLTAASVAMALGTVAQHATGTWIGMLLDHAGMQVANLAMVVVCLRRLFGTSWRTLLLGAALGLAALIAVTAAFDSVRRWFVVGGMVPCGLLELWLVTIEGRSTDHRWHLAGWIAFAVAIVLWVLDHDSSWCDPNGWWQLHAGWHGMSALALACWGLYYAQFEVLRARC